MQSSHAGRPEGTLEEQYALLEDAADVIAHAPGDELTAEILALQGELLVQVLLSWVDSMTWHIAKLAMHKAMHDRLNWKHAEQLIGKALVLGDVWLRHATSGRRYCMLGSESTAFQLRLCRSRTRCLQACNILMQSL